MITFPISNMVTLLNLCILSSFSCKFDIGTSSTEKILSLSPSFCLLWMSTLASLSQSPTHNHLFESHNYSLSFAPPSSGSTHMPLFLMASLVNSNYLSPFHHPTSLVQGLELSPVDFVWGRKFCIWRQTWAFAECKSYSCGRKLHSPWPHRSNGSCRVILRFWMVCWFTLCEPCFCFWFQGTGSLFPLRFS